MNWWRFVVVFWLVVVAARAGDAPVRVLFSSYLGGKGSYGEGAYAIAAGPEGRITVGGYSSSTNFPVTSLFGPRPDPERAFVTTIGAAGDKVLSSTVFPEGVVRAVARDMDGNLCIVGDCYYNFPATNAHQSEFGGNVDVFALKLSPGGDKLLFSTYIGGDREDMARSLAVDAQGNFHICGWTSSTNFPGRVFPANASKFDAFYVELDASGRSLVRSTVFGGNADSLANSLVLDGAGGVYVGGWTQDRSWTGLNYPVHTLGSLGWQSAFVAKIGSGTNCPFEYATFFGGAESQTLSALRLTSKREIVVFGHTESSDFPVTPLCWQPGYAGEGDYYLGKLDPTGAAFDFVTYFGGSQTENPLVPEYTQDRYVYPDTAGLVLDGSDNIYLGARTSSPDIVPEGLALSRFAGYEDGFVAKFKANGTALDWFLFLGGSGFDAVYGLCLDDAGDIYAAGQCTAITAPYFPVTPGAFQTRYGGSDSDAFIVKLSDKSALPPNDAFSKAIELIGSRTTFPGGNLGATFESGEPSCGAGAGGKTVWWSWTAPSSGRLYLTTTGSSFDTVLAVFTGVQLASLERLASNDNSFDGIQTSQISLVVSAGTKYWIAVDGAGGAAGGITLSLTLSVPANDDFANRITITNFPVDLHASNVDATREPDENQAHAEGLGTRSVWWQWQSPLTGNVTITTEGSSFDTRLAVYTGDNFANLQLIAVNDNATNGVLTSEVSFQAKARTRYQIAVDSVYDDSGAIHLQLLPGDPPANDSFAKRTRIDAAYTNIVAYNYGATRESGEPDIGVPNTAGKSIWWTWTAPADGRITLSTFGCDFDSLITVFNGASLGDLTVVASGDNSMRNGVDYYNVTLNFDVKSGAAYQIAVDGHNYWGGGEIHLLLHYYVPPVILANTVGRSPSFHFSAQGQPGKSYYLAASSNLEDWASASTNIYSGGLFECAAPVLESQGAAFYRLVEKQ